MSNVNVLVFLNVCVYGHRYVHFLSTAHILYLRDRSLPEIMKKDGRKKVPVPCSPLLHDYIKHMCGVDRGDQLVMLYNAGRKSIKAWKRIMYYLFECCMLNAFVIDGHFDERHKAMGWSKRDYKYFRFELAT